MDNESACVLQVYLNYAAKTNAGLWPAREGHIQDSGPLSAATVEAGSHSPNDGVTSEAENRKAATHSEMSRKRQKLNRPAALVEVDIDWEQPTALPSDATLQSSGTACSKQPVISVRDSVPMPCCSGRLLPMQAKSALQQIGIVITVLRSKCRRLLQTEQAVLRLASESYPSLSTQPCRQRASKITRPAVMEGRVRREAHPQRLDRQLLRQG